MTMKLNKIAVAGDFQFDLYPSLSRPDERFGTSRLRDIVEATEWVIDTATDNQCSALVMLGDIFNNRSAIDLRVIDAVGHCMDYAKSVGLPIYALVGNHDAYLRDTRVTSLRAIAGYATVIDKPCNLNVGGTPCAFVPWVDDHDEIREHLDTVLSVNPSVLFGHALVEGATMSDRALPLSWFKDAPTTIFGDVHEPGQYGKVQYIGSPLQLNFGDAGGERGMAILHCKGKNVAVKTIRNIHSPRFRVIEDDGESQIILRDIREVDYVRVKTEDPEIVESVRERVPMHTHVESTALDLEDLQPRLNVSVRDSHETVIKQYVGKYADELELEPNHPLRARLIKVGRELLEEANQ